MRASGNVPRGLSRRTSCRHPRSGIGARHRSCLGGKAAVPPALSSSMQTRHGASQPEPTEGWASRHAERPAIRGEPQLRTFQRDVQLGSPVGSPPPEHQPYLVQRDATPRVGRAPCHGALPLATPRGPLTRSGPAHMDRGRLGVAAALWRMRGRDQLRSRRGGRLVVVRSDRLRAGPGGCSPARSQAEAEPGSPRSSAHRRCEDAADLCPCGCCRLIAVLAVAAGAGRTGA